MVATQRRVRPKECIDGFIESLSNQLEGGRRMNILNSSSTLFTGYLQFLFIVPALLLFAYGVVKNSHRVILFSYIVFFPVFMALIFVEMDYYLLPLLMLPPIQVFYYFKLRNSPA